tara:strand:- start:108 stop:326 length:219 start_codon:yes stop_codon:yes gene_type:complete
MIITIISAITMTYSSLKYLNDDYFYQLETDQRTYQECEFKYVGKTLVDKNAKQFFAQIENKNKYIYWKNICK